jgi:hypothetical protein
VSIHLPNYAIVNRDERSIEQSVLAIQPNPDGDPLVVEFLGPAGTVLPPINGKSYRIFRYVDTTTMVGRAEAQWHESRGVGRIVVVEEHNPSP